MAEPRLVITVGTSLFWSASWKKDEVDAVVPGYRNWLDERFVERPNLRRTQGWKIGQGLEERLVHNPERFAGYLEWDPEIPRRYSGEITTALRLYQREAEGSENFEEFLRRRYNAIDLVCASGRKDASRIAADQLLHLLGSRLGHPGARLADVLVSPYLRERVEQFDRYLKALPSGPVDLLLTGGYKGFALQAGLLATAHPPGAWRLLYLHEEQEGELVISVLLEDRTLRQEFSDGAAVTDFVRPV